MADLLGLQQNGPDTTGMSFETDTAQDRAAALQAHNQNVKMSLLAAGLATLAAAHNRRRGERESLGGEIGQGGLVGLQNYENQEATIAKQQLAQQQLRGLQAYRQADLGIKGRAEQSLEGYRGGLLQNDTGKLAEAQRHNATNEHLTQEERDIAAANANTNAYRAKIDAARAGSEAENAATNQGKLGEQIAKDRAELAPIGKDILAKYRGTAVDKVIPLPDPATVAAMPRKDADALVKDIINSYSRMGTNKTYAPHYMPMGDGKIHKVWTDSSGDHDQVIGPAVIKNYGDLTGDPTLDSALTGGSPAATPAATPAPAPSNMPPPATPAATPAANLGTVPKKFWGQRVRVDGKVYKIDMAGNPVAQ